MKKILLLVYFILCTNLCAAADTVYYNNSGQSVGVSYDSGLQFEYDAVVPMAKQVSSSPIYTPEHIYMRPGMYYRTGYARPKTRFAQPNKRFAQPQTHFAHVRPKYIYTKEYQDNISNKHNPGMKRQFDDKTKIVPNTISRFDKNFPVNQNKKVSCGGITYYGISGVCK